MDAQNYDNAGGIDHVEYCFQVLLVATVLAYKIQFLFSLLPLNFKIFFLPFCALSFSIIPQQNHAPVHSKLHLIQAQLLVASLEITIQR